MLFQLYEKINENKKKNLVRFQTIATNDKSSGNLHCKAHESSPDNYVNNCVRCPEFFWTEKKGKHFYLFMWVSLGKNRLHVN